MDDTPSRSGRMLRIVYLKENAINEYRALTMNGISKAAREANVELVTYSGSASFDARTFDVGIQALYGFIRETRPDGLLVCAWLPEVREPNTRAFLDNFRELPVYYLGDGHPGIHYAHLYGAEYTRKLVAHMVERHGRRRVAFISTYTPDYRDEAYISYMKERGLWDETLYVLGEKIRTDMYSARA